MKLLVLVVAAAVAVVVVSSPPIYYHSYSYSWIYIQHLLCLAARLQARFAGVVVSVCSFAVCPSCSGILCIRMRVAVHRPNSELPSLPYAFHDGLWRAGRCPSHLRLSSQALSDAIRRFLLTESNAASVLLLFRKTWLKHFVKIVVMHVLKKLPGKNFL